MRVLAPSLLVALVTVSCSSDVTPAPTPPGPARTATTVPSPDGTAPAPPSPGRSPAPVPRTPLARFDGAAAMATVEHLAGTIGPREATGTAYRQAADYLADRFSAAGYVVRRQAVRVPAGLSWGVRVPAGMTWNVIATPTDFDPARPHRVVGAHLDTVPQAPGAEDNASGVAVLLEVARVVAGPDRQIAFVAFGAEEPRGSGDARHHYGSRAYVAAMPAAHRRALRGMVSLDRVGVGRVVPVCVANRAGEALQREVRAAAVRMRTPARPCTNRSSDHWSFARAGLAAIRLGSTPYPEYHSSRDLPRVVDRAQLTRVGRLLLSWLA